MTYTLEDDARRAEMARLQNQTLLISPDDARRLAHRNDPDTAKAAAADGALRKNTHRRQCLMAHALWPLSGLTDDECAAEAGLELHEARRRCSDLRNLGLIQWVQFGDRRETRKAASGKAATVSAITDAGYDALRGVAS